MWEDVLDQCRWTVSAGTTSLSTSLLKIIPPPAKLLGGGFSGMSHAINLTNNLYNFVKFNRAVGSFSLARTLNLHLC